eukprot:454857_1
MDDALDSTNTSIISETGHDFDSCDSDESDFDILTEPLSEHSQPPSEIPQPLITIKLPQPLVDLSEPLVELAQPLIEVSPPAEDDNIMCPEDSDSSASSFDGLDSDCVVERESCAPGGDQDHDLDDALLKCFDNLKISEPERIDLKISEPERIDLTGVSDDEEPLPFVEIHEKTESHPAELSVPSVPSLWDELSSVIRSSSFLVESAPDTSSLAAGDVQHNQSEELLPIDLTAGDRSEILAEQNDTDYIEQIDLLTGYNSSNVPPISDAVDDLLVNTAPQCDSPHDISGNPKTIESGSDIISSALNSAVEIPLLEHVPDLGEFKSESPEPHILFNQDLSADNPRSSEQVSSNVFGDLDFSESKLVSHESAVVSHHPNLYSSAYTSQNNNSDISIPPQMESQSAGSNLTNHESTLISHQSEISSPKMESPQIICEGDLKQSEDRNVSPGSRTVKILYDLTSEGEEEKDIWLSNFAIKTEKQSPVHIDLTE